MQGHLSGWIINYGGQAVIEANAAYRGYDLSPYRERCGLAAMSPAALGSTVWLRKPDGGYWGPCLVVDTVSRVDWHHSVIETGEIVEIPRHILKALYGADYGVMGEVFFGECPPGGESVPVAYAPTVSADSRRPIVAYSAWPYPTQGLLVDCMAAPRHYVEYQ